MSGTVVGEQDCNEGGDRGYVEGYASPYGTELTDDRIHLSIEGESGPRSE